MTEIILFALGSIITLIASGPGVEWVNSFQNKISWKRVIETLSTPQIGELLNGKDRPDIIVGLNGGIAPAGILALNYHINEIYFINLFPYIGPSAKNLTDFSEYIFPESIKDKKILLVDDQFVSGHSMELAVNILIKNGVKKENIKRFALFRYKIPSSTLPLEIDTSFKITGRLKKAPWIISEQMERFYKYRAQKP